MWKGGQIWGREWRSGQDALDLCEFVVSVAEENEPENGRGELRGPEAGVGPELIRRRPELFLDVVVNRDFPAVPSRLASYHSPGQTVSAELVAQRRLTSRLYAGRDLDSFLSAFSSASGCSIEGKLFFRCLGSEAVSR